MENGNDEHSAAPLCYAAGWRPEPALKSVAIDMLEILFADDAAADERESAAATLVEAVCPEITRRVPVRCGYHDEKYRRCLLSHEHCGFCEFD